MPLAKGTFEVRTSPLAPEEDFGGPAIGRFVLDKQFCGDLAATSKGLMLGAGDPKSGIAGYVAMEQVRGTLDGLAGSFALQHFGTMNAGKFDLDVVVVPGSGQGGLTGISGTMKITIYGAQHLYEFDYTVPEPS